ncbi:MAG: ATP-binding protein, partial [Opitutales bacterium]
MSNSHPGKSTPSHRPPPAGLVELVLTLPEPAVLTRDEWIGSGVEMVAANAAFGELTGYEPTALSGQNTRVLHGPRTDLSTLASGRDMQPPLTGENWLHRHNGTEFFAGWRFGQVQPGWMVGIYRDLSETKRLQEGMLHTEKLATVGQLAGGVAHDFNNLLSIINGYCEIMRGKLSASSPAQKDLQEIHRAGQKAAAISRQLLEFSRRQETEASVVNANTLIREISDILRRVMGEGVAVELRLASDLGNMRVDPTQFQQALLNLCFNARDAMPQGGKLTVRTFRQDYTHKDGHPPGLAARAYAITQVSDTGQGMDAATRQHTFQPFYTTKPHGTGLGLATVQSIVRRAGGEVTVHSELGHGTVFDLYLPETAEAEQIFSTTLAALPATRGTESLWLVEADEVIRKMVTGILSVDGYQVREFATPADALAA